MSWVSESSSESRSVERIPKVALSPGKMKRGQRSPGEKRWSTELQWAVHYWRRSIIDALCPKASKGHIIKVMYQAVTEGHKFTNTTHRPAKTRWEKLIFCIFHLVLTSHQESIFNSKIKLQQKHISTWQCVWWRATRARSVSITTNSDRQVLL